MWYLVGWYNDTIWGPKEKNKLMKAGPLVALGAWGFKPTENAFSGELFGWAKATPVAFVGTINGFAVEASFGWASEPYLMVRVFFDPGSHDYNDIMEAWRVQQIQAKQWKLDKGLLHPVVLFCAPVYVDVTLSYQSHPPKAAKLIALAEQLVVELQRLHRSPLDYSSACDLANAVLLESKRRTGIRETKG